MGLAAYVASRSPHDHDIAAFASTGARLGGKRRRFDNHNTIRSQNDRPRPATLDRLLAIHAFLAAEHMGNVPDVRDPGLLLTLSELAARNLIEQSSSPDDLANPRFICLLDTAPAFDLADAHRVPLGRYLPP